MCSKDSTRTEKLLLLLFQGSGEGGGVMEDVLKVSHVYVSHLTLDFCDVCVRVCESERHTFTFSFDSDSDSGLIWL